MPIHAGVVSSLQQHEQPTLDSNFDQPVCPKVRPAPLDLFRSELPRNRVPDQRARKAGLAFRDVPDLPDEVNQLGTPAGTILAIDLRRFHSELSTHVLDPG